MVGPAFVVDCSVTVAWCLNEGSGYAGQIADVLRDASALAPAIWPYEIANALVMAERRQRIAAGERDHLIALIDALDIAIDPAPTGVPATIAALAQQYQLTVYDAAYLELALRHGLPLATLDARLVIAARQAQLPRLAL